MYEGNLQDINEAIKLASEGCNIDNPNQVDEDNKATSLLGRCLNTRFLAVGLEDDLALSIDKSTLTLDKAQAYLFKYQKFGHIEDLEQVFQNGYFENEAARVAENVEGHDYYDEFQRGILYAQALSAKYKVENNIDFLEKAINNLERSRAFCPCTLQPNLIHCYLSLLLEKPFDGPEQLDTAINICREGLDLLLDQSIFSPLLKHVLGRLLFQQYNATENIKYLTASIQAFKESILFLNSGSSSSNVIHFDLGISLKTMFKSENGDQIRQEAIVTFQGVCNSLLSDFEIQYKAAIEWAKLAEEIDSNQALQAYEYVMSVLPHLSSLSLDIKNRHQRLTKLSLQGISSDAAACAIETRNIEKAVEFLEHGRSIFWQQAMNLHSSVEILQDIDPKLAKELATLARELNISSFHTQFKESSKNYQNFLNRQSSKRIALAEKWTKLLEKAQSIPGCETLLKPMPYSKLAYAASKSIVVLLSITDQTTHAIMIKSPDSPPTSLELPLVNRQNAEKMALTLQAILKGNNLRDASQEIEGLERSGRVFIPFNAALGEKKMYIILSELWVRIVKPVLDILNLKPTIQPVHITWCCTDILATLPIHAAGIYQGSKQENLFEYAMSSYTSVLSNLLSPAVSISLEDAQVLLAGMEKAAGYPVLPSVIQEIHFVQNVLTSAQKKTLIDSEVICNKLLENMANAHLVHLACHGIASTNPLESAIVLHDGHLKIDKLILGFLSACQTAKINPLEADESIHIAAAMLSTGFKSVIATLWSIDDGDAPLVAKAFYKKLIGHGNINIQDSALALHHATNELRKTGVSPLRWVPFIHMGV
ncbi:CHAT domain-containing protein [Cyathus striatus]|nr:CHAT domain-containing protein [Cyathus striatus]